jgi:CheY-like chemotaxis protein
MLRVLVVDDNRDAADTLAVLVKRWGHVPRVAYDGAVALIMAIDETPDVLFVDIGMPEMDGFELARQLRRQIRFADTLLVAVTGWADQEHRRLWQEAFDCYLIKPVDPPVLENLLRDRARLGRSRIGGQEADYNERLGEALDEKPSRNLAAGRGAACLVEQ